MTDKGTAKRTWEIASSDDKPAQAQLDAVWEAMRDGEWRSVEELAVLAECPPASASARLRDLRKPQYGGWDVERHYDGKGVWRYRVREKAAIAVPTGGAA